MKLFFFFHLFHLFIILLYVLFFLSLHLQPSVLDHKQLKSNRMYLCISENVNVGDGIYYMSDKCTLFYSVCILRGGVKVGVSVRSEFLQC